MPALVDVQSEFGHIPADSVAIIANAFNLSRADVHGVVTFYHDFRQTPPPRHMVKICQAEACQAMGARELTAYAKAALGTDFDDHNPDRPIGLEPVYCLGNCACTPAVMIDDKVYGRVDPHRLDELLTSLTKNG